MALVKGAPKVPANYQLKAEFNYSGPYQGGAAGLGVGRVVADYDYAADLWRYNGQPLDLPLGKDESPYPDAALIVTFFLPTGAYPLAVLPLVSPEKEYLDLRQPHYAPGYVSSPTLQKLLADGAALVGLRPALEATASRARVATADAEKAAAEARAAVETYNGTALFLVGATERGPVVTAINADRLRRDAVPLYVLGKPKQVKVVAVNMGVTA